MKKLMLLLLMLSMLSIWADEQIDPLWQKASDIASRNMNWVPGEMIVETSALNENGDKMMSISLMFSYELEDGDIAAYYDGGTRMGNLIPESDQMVQQILMQDMHPIDQSLFYNNESWNLQFKNTGITEKKLKHKCTIFEYTCEQPSEDGLAIPTTGKVWLDSETGAPVYNEQEMIPPQEMVEKITSKYTYDYKQGELTTKKMESVTSVNAMGQKGKMLNVAKFKKHWRYTEE